MAARTYMIEYRERNDIDLQSMAQKCQISKTLLARLESSTQEVTHPNIVERVRKAYKLTAKQAEGMLPEIYRKSSPNYDPDRYREDAEFMTRTYIERR